LDEIEGEEASRMYMETNKDFREETLNVLANKGKGVSVHRKSLYL